MEGLNAESQSTQSLAENYSSLPSTKLCALRTSALKRPVCGERRVVNDSNGTVETKHKCPTGRRGKRTETENHEPDEGNLDLGEQWDA